ncbi:MAG TPA: M1 family metallopeptidase [Planctomycetota bacterium]|nr:M1 family metallopeptidase [Planctomycetota bacterium]
MTTSVPTAIDSHSCARPEQVRVTHLDLDLTLDFQQQIAFGTVALALERHDLKAPLQLDTAELTIEAVRDGGGTPLEFQLGAAVPHLGRPLRVDLRSDTGSVVVQYRTAPSAAAMQWLQPAQTAGGRQPFLFTQGQAILTRSWIPLQDSPSVRVSWAARIRAPQGLRPVMSAMHGRAAEDGGFTFEMPQPVPSYLIALACGDLERREISQRCAVWAEPSVVTAAARELEDMEQMVAACEQLFGPYRWGRYDLIILPPSFPFGGMENPCLTFATPTLLAGDKSLVALVAHELAHSWSGNLVTNATWRDFWLNEGFTVYLERRIMEQVYGKDRADMELVLGMQKLAAELRELPAGDQILHIDLAGRDPDDAMTEVPYEKGAAFLRRLEQVFGRGPFDRFLRDYFAGHAFQSITTAEFEDWLQQHLLAAAPDQARQIDVQQWLHAAGLPADAAVPASRAFQEVDALRAAFLRDRSGKQVQQGGQRFVSQQWQRFLEGMPADLDARALQELDAALDFTHSGNAELLCAWLRLAIRADYRTAMPALEQFLVAVGRRKFIKPLYEELLKARDGKARAAAIYQRARPHYHTVAVRTLDPLLGYHG